MSPVEPGTGLAVLGAAYGGAKIVEKILGPTAEYIGDGIQNWTQKRVENIGRIFQNAHKKLGDQIDEPGAVPPRVLKEILDDGSFCDDELSAEYYGGVLASSRSDSTRDDRGATYLRLTSQLSNYQIRFHYICHYWWRRIFMGSNLRPNFIHDLKQMYIFVEKTWLTKAMDLSENEPENEIQIHCMSGLNRQDLIHCVMWGTPRVTKKYCKEKGWNEPSGWGIILRPTFYGIEYWLWGMAADSRSPISYLNKDLQIQSNALIEFSGGPQRLIKM